ncbi:MAG: hypothetical protein E2576_11980 [Alcaligenaceae bacterium]|nr:hypothetical protein [Alcaligenaceae bacterium SAGV5]MPS53533.1 hypothetical protein [Alcaligenaceae bacterium SAGV3]MPT57431.1 hypothetical protein [Alcaligenaceae bacterium]
MATHKLPVYPADHPVALALCAMFSSLDTGRELIETLADTAERVGVPFGSERFDEAAAMAGIPYCRSLDLYLDRQTQREAEALPFHLAHLALTH